MTVPRSGIYTVTVSMSVVASIFTRDNIPLDSVCTGKERQLLSGELLCQKIKK